MIVNNIIRFGDISSLPTVTVAMFHPVCPAFGQQQDHYRVVSVVVEYTCSGHANRLVPTVTGSSGDRELRLVLPLDDFLKNTQYTAQLTSISDEREVAAVGIITSECVLYVVLYHICKQQ